MVPPFIMKFLPELAANLYLRIEFEALSVLICECDGASVSRMLDWLLRRRAERSALGEAWVC